MDDSEDREMCLERSNNSQNASMQTVYSILYIYILYAHMQYSNYL